MTVIRSRTSVRTAAALALAGVAAVAAQTATGHPATTVVDSQAFLTAHLPPPAAGPLRPAKPSKRVADLLARMTLREKVGQMTQLTVAMVASGRDADLHMDAVKLQQAVGDYGVGSILNVSDQALPLQRWHEVLRDIQAAAAKTRLKIPVLYGIDTIHGANYVRGATLFPQPLGMAATWNPELMRTASAIAARETRAAGIPWNFSPVLDVGRQPLWPRLYETFGEDSYLGSVMGVATVRGYQGDDPKELASPRAVAATLKHYVGYSYPTTGHDRTPALIPELVLREHFLPPFAAAVRAGAAAVMVNSGEVNGTPGHANGFLLKHVLRVELGFDGLVVSDWEDIKKLVTIHRVAADEKEATRIAVLAGIDMSMVPLDYSFADILVSLVEEGAVPMARIDEAAGRVLALKEKLGLFDDPLLGTASGAEVRGAEARGIALQAARESIVLLANGKGVMPLREATQVLVTGPTCDSRMALNNGWSLVWQGNQEALYPTDRPTIRGALEAKLGPGGVTYLPGSTYDAEVDVAAAAAAAREADVAVVCLGEMAYAETPGNIDDLALPEAQLHLAKAVAESGKPMVLVLVEGRPRLVRPIVDLASAIVLALNPGEEGGQAIADVLFGDVNPSGKLPITYPRDPHALRTYDHKAFEEQDTGFGLTAFRPQFEFGSGLSYTTFEYSALAVTPKPVAPSGDVTVAVTVRNAGAREGAEVVQLYVSDLVASVTPPVKRLRRFAKVWLQPGESRQLTFTLSGDDLSFIGADNRRTIEPGDFAVSVGGLRDTFTLAAPSANAGKR